MIAKMAMTSWIVLAVMTCITLIAAADFYWRQGYRFRSLRFQLALALVFTTIAGLIDTVVPYGGFPGSLGALVAIRAMTFDRFGERVWIFCAIFATMAGIAVSIP